MKQYLVLFFLSSIISANATPCGATFTIKNDSSHTLKMSVGVVSGSKTTYWLQSPSSTLAPQNTTFSSLMYDSKEKFDAYLEAQDSSKVNCKISFANGQGPGECDISYGGACKGISYTLTGTYPSYTILYKN